MSKLTQREIRALHEYVRLIEDIKDVHYQWFDDNRADTLSDDELLRLEHKLKALKQETVTYNPMAIAFWLTFVATVIAGLHHFFS